MKKNNATGDLFAEKVPIKHFLLIMRVTIILLFAGVFCAMAETGYSQNARVSIDKRNVALKDVLNEIEQQTDYLFIYNNEVNTNQKVSIKTKQKAVSEVLNSLLKEKSINYSMEGNHIILSMMEKSALTEEGKTLNIVQQQQKKRITGTIVDVEGIPIIGANIVETGTSNGTITDIDGHFELNVSENATIHVSYIGYIDQDVSTTGKSFLAITLIEDTQALDEVVVIAYGSVKKKDLTGAVSSVDPTVITKQSNSTVSRALEGAAPGIQVSSIDGQPGVDMGIRIRGASSASQNSSSALIVIDGVPAQTSNVLSSINPKDIENITILKDAASTALYGSRGANGVVLITTKKGSKGKAKIAFEGRWGVNQVGPYKYEKISNPKDIYEHTWLSIYNAVRYGSNQNYTTNVKNPNMSHDEAALFASQHLFDYTGSMTNFERNQLGNFMSYNLPGAIYTSTGSGANASSTMSGQYLVNPDGKLNSNATLLYKDHYDDFFLQDRLRQEYNVSASGGSEKSDYFVSLGYLEDPSYIRGSEFERYNLRSNLNAQLLDWLKIGANMSYTNRRTQSPATRYGRNPGSAVANVFRWINGQNQLTPLYAHDKNGDIIYNEDGSKQVHEAPGMTYSPVGPTAGPLSTANLIEILDKDLDETVSNDLSIRGYAEVKFLKDFTFTANMSLDRINDVRTRYWNKETGSSVGEGGSLGKVYQNFTVLNAQQLLNYNKQVDLHNINVMVGHEFNKFNSDNLNYRSAYSLVPDFLGYSNFVGRYVGGTFANPGGSYAVNAMESYLGRASYIYNDKYYGELSIRRDGSSKFKYNHNRWGTFWSAGIGWRVTEEEFMTNTKEWLNNLKIRGSYGVIGNQSGIPNHSGYQTWSYGATYTQTTGGTGTPERYTLTKGNFVNDALTWENVHTLDLGIDFSLWNRVHGTIDYFVKNTANSVWSQPIPFSLGQSTLEKNSAKLQNKGLEVELGIDIIKNKDLYWNISLNGVHYKTTLTDIPPGVGTDKLDGNFTAGIDSWGITGNANTGGNIAYLRGKGKDFYNLYFFKYGGVDQETGLPLFYAKVTEEDHANGHFKEHAVGDVVTTTNHSLADRFEMGSATPKWIGGFTTSLNYKNFDLLVNLAYQIGGKFLSVEYANGLYRSDKIGSALSAELIGNTWTPENTNAYFPMVMYGNNYGDGATKGSWEYTDMALFDASYLNVKNITLGYTLPKSMLNKINVAGIRLFATGDNIFMFAGHAGFDPRMSLVGGLEVGAYAFPYMRSLSFGVDVSF